MTVGVAKVISWTIAVCMLTLVGVEIKPSARFFFMEESVVGRPTKQPSQEPIRSESRIPVKWTFWATVTFTVMAWAALVFVALAWPDDLSEKQEIIVDFFKSVATIGTGIVFSSHIVNMLKVSPDAIMRFLKKVIS